nr:extensin-like [Aegilops tauschii subsp. strangulata]
MDAAIIVESFSAGLSDFFDVAYNSCRSFVYACPVLRLSIMSAPDPPQPIAHWPIPAAFTPAPPATAQPQPLSYLACLARPSQPLPWGFPDPQRSPRPAPRESDPDPDWGTPPPPPPGRPSSVGSEVDCVLETPPELLPRALPTTVSNAPASGRSANPSCIDGVIGGDRSGWLACFRPAPA